MTLEEARIGLQLVSTEQVSTETNQRLLLIWGRR